MQRPPSTPSDRQAGADAIAARATAIAREKGIVIVNCVWDLGDDLTHEHAHRLDLFAEAKTVRLYFSDLELTGAPTAVRIKRTDDRLHSAVAQLISTAPSPTYSYR